MDMLGVLARLMLVEEFRNLRISSPLLSGDGLRDRDQLNAGLASWRT